MIMNALKKGDYLLSDYNFTALMCCEITAAFREVLQNTKSIALADTNGFFSLNVNWMQTVASGITCHKEYAISL